MSESKSQQSLDEILENFTLGENIPDPAIRKALTIWLSPEHKEKYDRIQRKSGRKFCEKVRELVVAAIDRCDPQGPRAA